jgi:hypothetical protein
MSVAIQADVEGDHARLEQVQKVLGLRAGVWGGAGRLPGG